MTEPDYPRFDAVPLSSIRVRLMVWLVMTSVALGAIALIDHHAMQLQEQSKQVTPSQDR